MYDALMDGFLAKSARNKWKEMILGGGLSGAAKINLLKQYVNPERMIAGLNRGSDNIIKSHGVNAERLSILDRMKAVGKGELPKDVMGMPYATSPDTRDILLSKGFGYNHLPSFISGNPFSIKHRSSQSMPNRYIDALAKRHEVDEVRVGRKMLGKQTGNPEMWHPNKKVLHWSPEVVMRESENVAFAPGAVRKKFKKVREWTGEVPVLKGVGFEYGQKTLHGKQRREAVGKLLSP